MKKTGNGEPAQCLRNLLLLTRGEAPYARMKGLDAALTDMPAGQAAPRLLADAEWLVRSYEPRAILDGAALEAALAMTGDFAVNARARGAGNRRQYEPRA